MRIRRDDRYEIDTDRERLNVPRVHEWLTNDAYWALGRHPSVTEKAIAGSLCFGVYHPMTYQVGFARAVTDGATFAWLCDVYIARASRGLGLGTWLARTAHDHLTELGLPRIVLATADAHEIYAKAGFAPLLRPSRWMEVDRRRSSDPGDVDHK